MRAERSRRATRLRVLVPWLAALALASGCGSGGDSEAGPGVVARAPEDGPRFTDHHDGTVTDGRTGLMWVGADNGDHVTWDEARDYIGALETAGYEDWRLPSTAELVGLYRPGRPGRVPPCTEAGIAVRIDQAIGLSCGVVWAAEHDEINASLFNFFWGKSLRMNREDIDGEGALALAVRDLH